MSFKDQVAGQLDNSSFTLVYNDICKLMEGDIASAMLMSRFISLEEHFRQSGQLELNDWFFQQVEPITRELGLSASRQTRCIGYLVSQGYLETMKMACPTKGPSLLRYIKINMDTFLRDLGTLRSTKENKDMEEAKKAFYATLNCAWELGDFAKALDKIPPDIGEFMYAWTHAYSNVITLRWKWGPRDFGILKQYWNATYRGIRLFDYNRLESYFNHLSESFTISGFTTFDKALADGGTVTTLFQHIKNNPNSIFK